MQKSAYFFDSERRCPYYCAPMADTLDFASPVPAILDSRKVFRQGLLIEGSIAVAELKQLCSMLSSAEGRVSARLEFGFDDARRRKIEGRVYGELSLQCQRCLDTVRVAVSEPINLAVVSSEDSARQLPADIDPLLDVDEEIRPPELIEEQMILGLPIVATHKHCEPHTASVTPPAKASEKQSASSVSNPFAVLAALKNNSEKNSDTH